MINKDSASLHAVSFRRELNHAGDLCFPPSFVLIFAREPSDATSITQAPFRFSTSLRPCRCIAVRHPCFDFTTEGGKRIFNTNESKDPTRRGHRSTSLTSRGAKKPISKSNIHKLLRKRVYTGDFDWNGNTYRGSHQPLISTELFARVQEILDGRFTTKQKVAKHEFAFSGLVSCGHCGVRS